MAEEQKIVEVPKDTKVEETAPVATEAPKVETSSTEPKTTEEVAPAVDAAAPTGAATEEKPAEEPKTAEAATEAATEEAKPEEKKEEVKPIEEGYLNHKAQGLSFPKNFIGSKEFVFFGSDAVEPKNLSAYQRHEKSAETAHSNISWASETGNGLLFIGDKKAPTGIINLSDASEPETDGSNKFTLTSKGNKHTFKAASTAERDNWVSQLKLKIAAAKDLVATVTESETYKKTQESFKPAPIKKDEKVAEAPKDAAVAAEEAPKVEEAPATEEAAPKTEETPKTEEAPKKAESPKPLKAKRTSFFGFMTKKDEPKDEKKDEVKTEEPKTEEAPKVDEPVKTEEAPKTEETPVVATTTAGATATEEAPKVEETPAAATTDAVAPEEKTAEEAKPAESPKEKSKRNSFFGNVFSKKEKKPEAKAAEAAESPKEETAPTTETAPVIPPVEASTPLAVDVSSPATAPTETTEVPAATTAAATNGEPRKDAKEKRKSSLPFLGKREKSPSPAEGEEKSPLSAFSKIRATIKSKTSHKDEKKPTGEAVKEEDVKEDEVKDAAAPAATSTDAPAADAKVAGDAPAATDAPAVTEPKVEAPKVDEPVKPEETKPESAAAPAPAVSAAA